MLKTNLLTPVLSGVLAVSVAGSGVLYVLDRNDKNDTADKTARNENTVLAKLSDRISGAAASVDSAVKGETENGYTCNAELSFGSVFTDMAGVEIKPISLKADSKIKGGKSEADLQLSYDAKSLANVYIITDNETGTAYLKCPELGDSYLSMSADDLAGLLKSTGAAAKLPNTSISQLPSGLGQLSSGLGVSGSAISGLTEQPDLDELQNALKDIDFKALSKDLEEYWQVIKDKVPEGEKKEDITGEIAGHSYTYEVKTIDITLGTLKDMATALADKAKDDQLVKDNLAKAGVTEEDYKKLIDSLITATNSIGDQQSQQKLFSLDVYTYEGEEVGFDLRMNGLGSLKAITINNEEVFAIDVSASVIGSSLKLNGSFEMNGDAVNGSAALDMTSGGKSVMNANLTVSDLLISNDMFTGSIGFDLTSEGNVFAASLVSAGTADNPEITLGTTYNGEKAFDLKITGEKTGASDVTVPTGNIYPLTEEGLKSFQESCNVQGFKDHIKEVLGDELYNKLTENSLTKKLEQNNEQNQPEEVPASANV